jgi:arginase
MRGGRTAAVATLGDMTVIRVPYHLDERLPDADLPVDGGTEVAAALPESDVWARLARLYDQVADAVAAEVRAGSRPAVVSGDCTVSIGIAAGLQRAGVDPAVVWIDAHGDVQTLETSTSGYLGGTALRLLLGYRHDRVAGPLGLRPPAEDRVVLVDARDLDPAEADYLASVPLRRLAIADLAEADLPDGPLLLNLDLDTLDPEVLPGLRYPAPGGPDAAALLGAVRTVLGTGRVAALNLACTWHPRTGPDRVREDVAAAVLADFADAAA